MRHFNKKNFQTTSTTWDNHSSYAFHWQPWLPVPKFQHLDSTKSKLLSLSRSMVSQRLSHAVMEARDPAMVELDTAMTMTKWHVLSLPLSRVERLQSHVQMAASALAVLEPENVMRADQYVTQTRSALRLRLHALMEASISAMLEPKTASTMVHFVRQRSLLEETEVQVLDLVVSSSHHMMDKMEATINKEKEQT